MIHHRDPSRRDVQSLDRSPDNQTDCTGSIYIGRPVVVLFLFCWSAVVSAAAPEPMPAYAHSQQLRDDASLHGVAFVDNLRGVACGDRGTILTTDDAGETWQLRNSGVDCRLSDVLWIDRQRLVIVGGGYDRITQISRAVVLTSDDGGERWRQISVDDLPRLSRVDRRNDGSLMALGDWSHAMLTDRFQSHDNGKTWIADLDQRAQRRTFLTGEQRFVGKMGQGDRPASRHPRCLSGWPIDIAGCRRSRGDSV